MLRSIIFGQLRGLLQAAFGYLAVHGYLSNDDATSAVTSVLFILTLAWSAFEKWKIEQSHKAEVARLS